MDMHYVENLYFGERAAMKQALAENAELHRQIDAATQEIDRLTTEIAKFRKHIEVLEALWDNTESELKVYIEMQERLNHNLRHLPDLADLIEMYQTQEIA